MKPVRKLHLRKETLGELSAAELRDVVGAVAVPTVPVLSCIDLCLTKQKSLCGCISDQWSECC